MILALLIGSIALVYVIAIIYFHCRYPELRWDWKNINTKKINFPLGFSWGTANASHQVEGNCTNNNWFLWEN